MGRTGVTEQRGGTRDLEPGTRVEVRDAYQGHWNRGFVVESLGEDGYSVRRISDDSVLSRPLPRSAVRRERRNSMWWM